MQNEKKSIITYLIFGILAGTVSYYLNSSLMSLSVAIVVLVGLHYVLNKVMKSKEKFQWFMSNGGWLYIFVWFIIWTIMYNVM
ncbi:MAG: hypothetical protein KJ906_04450 [Nanoarchaeota archaeon]|nr:hypothetical protein [Nanoarchaeota archaeon]